METMNKIGIMGGTFNPIHNGHIEMAKVAYKQFQLDKVLFMPSGNSYLKKNVLEASHRVEMVKRAIKEYPYFELSLIEVERKGNTYTYETLEQLHKQNRNDQYYFIVGMDSFMYMDKWYKPEIIFSNATILCALRDNFESEDFDRKRNIYQEKYDADIQAIHMPKIEISSTMIRNHVHDHLPIQDFVPKAVYEYITKEKLYAENKEVFER